MGKKKIIVSILVFSMVIGATKIYAKAFEDNSSIVNVEATEYVEEVFSGIVDVLMYSDTFLSRISDRESLKLGEPYIVFIPEVEVQEKVYYYPIIDAVENEVVYLIEAIGTSEGYICNALDHMVDVLNEIEYVDNPCIVYSVGNDTFIESASQMINVTTYYNDEKLVQSSEEMLSVNLPLENFEFEEKQELVFERMNHLMDYESCQWNNELDLVNSKMYGTLELYKPQGQYSYGICWASSVATVYNYLTTSVISGVQVCNRMGISLNEGGTIYDEQDALALYNIYYNNLRLRELTWGELTNNINQEKPIIINGFNTYGVGHAVTIYGYTGTSSTTGYVQYWNSALNSGQGGNAIFRYGSGQFSSGDGYTYDWETTLSYY